MVKNYSGLSSCFIPALFLVVFLFYTGLSIAQVNLAVDNNTTISAIDPTMEVDNVIYNNSSKLTINGTLIVNGDFNMNINDASLELGEGARLIVYGNFIAANKVEITLQKNSYFFVFGNFSKGGSSNQDVIIIDSAKIYILGNGVNWGGNFTNCGGTYDGTTKDTGDTCDFGNEEDYENNQDEFPDDLVEQLNCYDLTALSSNEAWDGGDATFSVEEIPGVDYQWQKKASATDSWIELGQNSRTLNLTNLSLSDSGNEYRVKVTPKGASDCRISISRKVRLQVNPIPQIENGSPEILCSGESIEFRVEEIGVYSYSWYRTDSGGNNFFPINDSRYSGTNTSTMIVASERWMNNQNFRVEITNSQGKKAFSNIVNLQVNESPGGIWNSPENIVACEGADTYFNVNSSGENIQWQVSLDEGVNWEDLQNNTNYNNVTTSNLNIINVPLVFNNNLYRVKLYNENCIIYSDSARLSVNPDPITEQPQDVYVEFGANAIFQAEIQGGNLSYQWQTFSSNWYNLQDGQHYQGTQTRVLELIEVGYWPEDGSRYRLVVTNENGCISVSEEAVLNIGQNPCEDVTTWTGTADTNWNNTNNWTCNSLPTLETDVLIPGSLASNNFPLINTGTNALTKNLSIETGASVIINGNLRIAGDLTNSGILNAETGSVSFEGNSAQNIPVGAFQNNRIRNLRIDNTSGVTSEAIIEVTGELLVETGNFNTGNSLTLISDATQTALIDGSGNGQVVGTVKMQRYLDVAFGYKYFSSPFSNSIVGDFSSYVDLTAAFPNFYIYNENREDASNNDATGWESYTSASGTLNILNGYALNFGNSLISPKTIEISGTVNNGDQQITLVNNKRKYTDGFNLVGNPYPSPIDWNSATGWTKSNIDNALYFFTAGNTNMYTGTYTSYVNGVQSADGLSSNIIPSMQGFFVHVTDTGIYPVSATLGMTNEVRKTDFSQEFLKTPEYGKFMSLGKQVLKSPEPEKVPLIRITAAFENEVNTDPTVIYFPNFAELSFEKDKDALKLMNTDITVPNLYSLTPENKKLSISALPKPWSGDVKKIPLGLKTEKDGWMLIGLQDLQDLPANFNIYLIDSEKRIGQNLSRKPQYRFYATSGQHHSRFHLMFSETEISDPAIAFDEPFSVKTVGGKVMVSMNLEPGQKGVLMASTITGQILDSKNVAEKETIEIHGIKSSGLYFFSINLKDGMFSKKVLIQK